MFGELTRPEQGAGIIYGLCEPDGAIRYVGQTRQSLRRRLQNHLCEYRRAPQRAVCAWIAERLRSGTSPGICLIAGPMPAADLDVAEREHIERLKTAGADLLNLSTGGVSGGRWRMAPESVRKSAEAKRGKPRSPETRAKLSAANLGQKPSVETLRKRSEALRGKKQSPEWIAKRVAAIAATKARKLASRESR